MHFVKLAEAAKELGLTEYALRKGVREGLFPHLYAGGKYWFDMEQLESAIRERMTASMCRCPEEPERSEPTD